MYLALSLCIILSTWLHFFYGVINVVNPLVSHPVFLWSLSSEPCEEQHKVTQEELGGGKKIIAKLNTTAQIW